MTLPFLLPRHTTAGDRIYSILYREGRHLSHEHRSEIVDAVLTLAREYDLHPMLIVAIMKVESQFDLRARSHMGALGLMQVTPLTVREIAPDLNIEPNPNRELIYHPRFNLRLGVHYLSYLIERFDGDITKALIAYNQGPTSVARNYKNGPIPLRGYARKVLNAYRDYLGS